MPLNPTCKGRSVGSTGGMLLGCWCPRMCLTSRGSSGCCVSTLLRRMAGGIGNHPFVYPDNHPGADYGNGVWVDVIQPERRGGAP